MVLGRKWKITETGDIGSVSISFDLTGVTAVSDKELANYTLVIDDNEDMSSPLSQTKPTSLVSNEITFENIDVADGQYIVLGTSVDAAPSNVSANIRLWIKASQGGVNWTDVSGNGVSLTMDGTVNVGTTMNFNPTNSFDGTAHFDTDLSINHGTYGDVSILAVYSPNVNNSGGVWGEDNLGWDRFIVDGDDDTIDAGVSNGGGMTFEPSLFVVGTTTLSSVILDNGNTSTVHVQGDPKLSFTSNQVGTSTNLEIGAIGDNNSLFDGRIAEIIVYSDLLTSADREKLETYLGIKYGVTLSHNYYSTAYDGSNAGSTTIFDVSNGYANDIAGIGREDNESLVQNKSKSENTDAVITIGSADDLGDVEYLVWGNDDGALTETATDLPSGISQMLTRKWIASEQPRPFLKPNCLSARRLSITSRIRPYNIAL
jgi:hypothetical protein